MRNCHYDQNGFDFEVAKVPSYFANPETGDFMPNGQYTILGESNTPIGNVGGQYSLFTNARFMELANAISNITGMEISHYTSIDSGKNILVAFKAGDTSFQIGEQIYSQDNKLILMDNRAGTRPFIIGANRTLHRCSNMFSSTNVVRAINHNSKMLQLIQELKDQIEKQVVAEEKFIQWQIKMASIEVSPQIIQEAKSLLFNLGDVQISATTANKLLRFENSLETEMAAVGQNAWGLFNGVTHFTTHNLSPSKITGKADFPLFGLRAKMNEQIYDFLTEKFN